LFFRICLVILLCSYTFAPNTLAKSKENRAWRGELVRVIDGDSLVVLREGEKTKVRLWGIDCPDGQRPYSAES
jgi:endonuclease YncB( thermonuclease family)